MEIAFTLSPLVAAKLIVYTFGALVNLFMMVLILGQAGTATHGRRRFEWLLFAFFSAAFIWNSGNLLSLNVALTYGSSSRVLWQLGRLIPFVGFVAAPPLLVHVHREYLAAWRPWDSLARLIVIVFYLPLFPASWAIERLVASPRMVPLLVLRPFLLPLTLWMLAALLYSAAADFWLSWQITATDERSASCHLRLAGMEIALTTMGAVTWIIGLPPSMTLGKVATLAMFLAVLPGAFVGYWIYRHNFLNLRLERNVLHSVVAIFVLLIYIDFIRRLSGFLEGHHLLPAAVTEGVMIFLMVVFLEPVKKRIGRSLEAGFASEFERVQHLSAGIQEFAKSSGDVQALKRFVEENAPRELGLQQVLLRLSEPAVPLAADTAAVESNPQSSFAPEKAGRADSFPIRRGDTVRGYLDVTTASGPLGADQYGALQVLADQLAASFELCRLIADKVKLEHELAEKAKMAFLGEMAARIAHNVKNPLSSMKTIVQLLQEDSSLPTLARADLGLVVAEIDRLNANVSQVLRYAKPARDTDRPADLVAVVSRAVTLARAEADRRRVRLDFVPPGNPCLAVGGEDAANDIVSNLLVNALEASPNGGSVYIRLVTAACHVSQVALGIEDEGPGIPEDLQDKVFEPFFTTRPGGTGLGLAIVARRAEEIGGGVECRSPVDGGKGTRFTVRFQAYEYGSS